MHPQGVMPLDLNLASRTMATVSYKIIRQPLNWGFVGKSYNRDIYRYLHIIEIDRCIIVGWNNARH